MKTKTHILTICTAAVMLFLSACSAADSPSSVSQAVPNAADNISDGVEPTATVVSDSPVDDVIAEINATGFSLDIRQYYDFDKAEWKPGAEAEIEQIQYSSPSDFSRTMAKVYAILDEYAKSIPSQS